jgi:hypothetical protein
MLAPKATPWLLGSALPVMQLYACMRSLACLCGRRRSTNQLHPVMLMQQPCVLTLVNVCGLCLWPDVCGCAVVIRMSRLESVTPSVPPCPGSLFIDAGSATFIPLIHSALCLAIDQHRVCMIVCVPLQIPKPDVDPEAYKKALARTRQAQCVQRAIGYMRANEPSR